MENKYGPIDIASKNLFIIFNLITLMQKNLDHKNVI